MEIVKNEFCPMGVNMTVGGAWAEGVDGSSEGDCLFLQCRGRYGGDDSEDNDASSDEAPAAEADRVLVTTAFPAPSTG